MELNMIKILSIFVLTVFTFGCGPRYIDYFPCHDDGVVKPVVALLPLIDDSELDNSFDLPNELTKSMRCEIRNSGELYLLPHNEVEMHLSQMGKADIFGKKDALLSQHFCNADFVVLTELISHEIIPYEVNTNIIKSILDRKTLQISMRIKILDVRDSAPHIVLQEILTNQYPILRRDLEIDLNNLQIDSENYKYSSICRAHQQLVYTVVKRMEEVIRSAF